MKPQIITRCVANAYTGPNERIVEFSDRELSKGGLIRLARHDDGTLHVIVYRCDPGVIVHAPSSELGLE